MRAGFGGSALDAAEQAHAQGDPKAARRSPLPYLDPQDAPSSAANLN